jgi:hypothetical protein
VSSIRVEEYSVLQQEQLSSRACYSIDSLKVLFPMLRILGGRLGSFEKDCDPSYIVHSYCIISLLRLLSRHYGRLLITTPKYITNDYMSQSWNEARLTIRVWQWKLTTLVNSAFALVVETSISKFSKWRVSIFMQFGIIMHGRAACVNSGQYLVI